MGWAVPLALLMLMIVVDLVFTHKGWQVARAMELPRNQTMRFVTTLAFGPIMTALAAASLVGAGVLGRWQDVPMVVVGAGLGLMLGRRRYLKQYLRADPTHRAIVVMRSLLDYRLLSILIVLGTLTVAGWLSLLLALVVALIVLESVARSWLCFARYKAETAGLPAGDRPARP
jgi:hypothetical protein